MGTDTVLVQLQKTLSHFDKFPLRTTVWPIHQVSLTLGNPLLETATVSTTNVCLFKIDFSINTSRLTDKPIIF